MPTERDPLLRRIEAGFAVRRYAFLSRSAAFASLPPALLLCLVPSDRHLVTFPAGVVVGAALWLALSLAVLASAAGWRLRGQEAVVVAPLSVWTWAEAVLLAASGLAAAILTLPALELVRLPAAAVAGARQVWAWCATVLVGGSVAAALLRWPRPWPAVRAAVDSRRPSR